MIAMLKDGTIWSWHSSPACVSSVQKFYKYPSRLVIFLFTICIFSSCFLFDKNINKGDNNSHTDMNGMYFMKNSLGEYVLASDQYLPVAVKFYNDEYEFVIGGLMMAKPGDAPYILSKENIGHTYIRYEWIPKDYDKHYLGSWSKTFIMSKDTNYLKSEYQTYLKYKREREDKVKVEMDRIDSIDTANKIKFDLKRI